MLADVDYIGIAAVITAAGGAVAAVVAAIYSTRAHAVASDTNRKMATNGDTRDLGTIVSDVAHAVGSPSPDVPPDIPPSP